MDEGRACERHLRGKPLQGRAVGDHWEADWKSRGMAEALLSSSLERTPSPGTSSPVLPRARHTPWPFCASLCVVPVHFIRHRWKRFSSKTDYGSPSPAALGQLSFRCAGLCLVPCCPVLLSTGPPVFVVRRSLWNLYLSVAIRWRVSKLIPFRGNERRVFLAIALTNF